MSYGARVLELTLMALPLMANMPVPAPRVLSVMMSGAQGVSSEASRDGGQDAPSGPCAEAVLLLREMAFQGKKVKPSSLHAQPGTGPEHPS